MLRHALTLVLFISAIFSHGQANDVFQTATLKYEEGSFEETIKICDKLIGSEEDNFEVWLLKGNALQKQEKYVAALQTYETALKLNQESSEAYANAGSAYFNLAQYEKAEKNVQKALKINSDLPEANYYMGNVKYIDFNLNTAIKYYSKAVSLKPGFRDALYMRAAAYAERGEYHKAISDYEKVLEIDPKLDVARVNIAALYVIDENYEKAFEEMDKVENLEGQAQRDFYFFKAEALYFSGDKEEACTYYEKASGLGDEEASEILNKYCLNKEERKAKKTKRVIQMAF